MTYRGAERMNAPLRSDLTFFPEEVRTSAYLS